MNKALAILHMYPGADPTRDFIVMDEGDGVQRVAIWNVKDAQGNPVPEPTETELLAAWEAYQANPPIPEPTAEQKIATLQEQLAIEQEDKLMVMEALAEVYEMVLSLQGGGETA